MNTFPALSSVTHYKELSSLPQVPSALFACGSTYHHTLLCSDKINCNKTLITGRERLVRNINLITGPALKGTKGRPGIVTRGLAIVREGEGEGEGEREREGEREERQRKRQ